MKPFPLEPNVVCIVSSRAVKDQEWIVVSTPDGLLLLVNPLRADEARARYPRAAWSESEVAA